MTITWWGVIGTSLAAFALKYVGHSIPSRFLEHHRVIKISALIPIALLSALVAVQSFTEKTKLTIDHRSLGLAVALMALIVRAPFPIVVISAALSSAVVYHLS